MIHLANSKHYSRPVDDIYEKHIVIQHCADVVHLYQLHRLDDLVPFERRILPRRHEVHATLDMTLKVTLQQSFNKTAMIKPRYKPAFLSVGRVTTCLV